MADTASKNSETANQHQQGEEPQKNESKPLVAEELRSLREEILTNDRACLHVVAFSVSATILLIIPAFSINEPHPFIFLIPQAILLAAFMYVRAKRQSTIVIAGYILVELEGRYPELRWESAYASLRKYLNEMKKNRERNGQPKLDAGANLASGEIVQRAEHRLFAALAIISGCGFVWALFPTLTIECVRGEGEAVWPLSQLTFAVLEFSGLWIWACTSTRPPRIISKTTTTLDIINVWRTVLGKMNHDHNDSQATAANSHHRSGNATAPLDETQTAAACCRHSLQTSYCCSKRSFKRPPCQEPY